MNTPRKLNPITTLVFAILLSYNLITYNKLTVIQNEASNLREEVAKHKSTNEALFQENKILVDEIKLRQDITSLIIDAARSYDLDPELLARVIKSESNFRPKPRHALPHVVGPSGVNIKMWKKTLHNPHTYVGNIYAGAEILRHYIDSSDSLTLALARYKGLSPLGLSQAKKIIEEYTNE